MTTNGHETINQTIDAYEQWMRSWTSSEATITARRTIGLSRLRAWGGPEGITTERIEAWLAEYSGWSKATYYQHMRSLCTWLHLSQRLDHNPAERLVAPSQPKSLPRPLSRAQVDLVMANASDRQRAWLTLTLYQGLRAHEIAKLKGEDLADGMLYVRGKGGKDAYLPIHAEVAALAQRMPPTGYWFPGRQDGHLAGATISRYVGELFKGLGIDGSLHRGRHSFGTNLVRAGVHVRKVQHLMRHADLSTTAIYTALDEDELRDAINTLPSGVEAS